MMLPDSILLFLIFSVAVLLGMAVAFALGVLLLRGRNEKVAARRRTLEGRWNALLLDVLAGQSMPGLLQSLVHRRDERHFLEFLARYSRRLQGAAHVALARLAKPHWRRVERMLKSRSAETRAHAVQIASMLAEDADAQIAPALDDDSPLVNMVAARALARRRSVGYLPAILERSGRFSQWHPRFMAAMLAGLGVAAAENLRAELANASADSYIRMVAADALKRMHDLPAARTAVDVLEKCGDADVQRECIRLLGVVGQLESVPTIRSFMRDPDDSVRGAAVAAIGTLGSIEDLPLLRIALDDQSRWVVLHAATAIRQIGGAEVLGTACETLSGDAVLVAEIREMAL